MDFLILPVGILIALLSAALGVALGRYVWPASLSSDSAAYAVAQAEVARLDAECIALRDRAHEYETDIKTERENTGRASAEIARLNERTENYTKQIDDLAILMQTVENQRHSALNECKFSSSEVAQLRERES